MFHICFAADENYIKYTAVLITSIVKSTDTSRKFKDFFETKADSKNADTFANATNADTLATRERERESKSRTPHNEALTTQNPTTQHSLSSHTSLKSYKKLDYETLSDDEKSEGYIFHILTDKISENTRQKLEKLAQNLSEIYPCKVKIHICDDSIFDGLPKFKGNYLAWFRIFIVDVLSSNVRVCLYLDTDMFVFGDLRELFSLDLTNKFMGIVRGHCAVAGLFAKNRKDKDFYFDNFYFNTGFLFFNLDEWRKNDLKDKVLDFANKYHVVAPDQDSLNCVIRKENALILPYQYNMLISYYYPNVEAYLVDMCMPLFLLEYTKDELDFAHQNPMIWHFAGGEKLWNNEYIAINSNYEPLGFCWWKFAFQTPFFKDEIKKQFNKNKDNLIFCKDFGFYMASLINEHSKSLLGYVKMPFVVWNAFKNFDLSKNDYYASHTNANLDKNLAFELFYRATKAWCRRHKRTRILKIATLPYKIYRAKCRCKKGNFRANRECKYHKLYTK